MKIDKNDKLIFLAVSLASAGILFNFLLKPHIARFEAVKTQHLSQKDLINVRDVKKSEISEIRDNTENWEKKANDIKNKFIKKDETTSFFKRLDQLAKKSGMKIYSVDPLEKKNETGEEINEMVVEVNAAGTYVGIMNFSKHVFENEKFINIKEMKIMPSDDEGPGILELEMVLELYIR